MIKKITCIDCPKGCQLEVNIENGRVISVGNNECEKGPEYAKQEIENPMRILASTVLTQGLPLKMLPVRTNKPIPKEKLFEAMEEIRKIKVSAPVKINDVIVKNLLGLGIDIIATRETHN